MGTLRFSRDAGPVCLLAALLATAACGGPTPSSEPPAATLASPPVATPSPEIAVRTPPLQAPGGPQAWFGPLPPLPPGSPLPFSDGSVDYLALWSADEPWAVAADHVRVFSIAETYVHHYATDDELRTIISGVKRHGMALALEVGPLPGSDTCGAGVEGFEGVYTLDQVRRIQRLGGIVNLVALDEPFAFGRFFDGPNACRWTTAKIAEETAEYVRQLRELEPDVVVGDIEPVWRGISANDFAEWVDAYRGAAGEPFAFFHIDSDWTRADWPQAALATEHAARSRGVPVGMYYNGGDAESDATWTALAMHRASIYEEVFGGRPDRVLFGSWFDHPDHLLPETDPTTFTGLINRYYGARTAIDVPQVKSTGLELIVVDGTLTTTGGTPVVGSLSLEATPLDGQAQVISRTGVVPAGASKALVVFRVNTEGAGPGKADLRIYEVAYTLGGGSANRVRNPRFSRGLDGWGAYGKGRASVVASDRGRGQMLRLVASRSQALSIDSTSPIAVTPGANYRLSVRASVPEASSGSAYVAVIFLGASEMDRHTLPLAPVPIALSTVMSTTSGAFAIRQRGLEAGRYRLVVSYEGDLSHWPTHSESIIQVASAR